jgi:hypothetical protein
MSEYNVRVLGGIGDGVSDDGPVLAEAARRFCPPLEGCRRVPAPLGHAHAAWTLRELHEAFT